MSGGYFEYNQYSIKEIADQIQEVIDRNGKLSQVESDSTRRFSDETIQEFHQAVKYLRIAKEYADRVDQLISGDDSEQAFHQNLKQNLQQIETD